MILYLIVIIVLEFLLIFLLSRQIFTLLYTLLYLPLKHHNISNSIVSLLFLPGTAIHEFSHALVAKLLKVEVGQIMLYPHRDKESGEFKAGSIEIEQVDPIRLALIGIAPSFTGIFVLTLIIYYLFNFSLPLDNLLSIPATLFKAQNLLFFLGIFMVSMTMFTSKRDLKEFLLVAPIFVLIYFIFYLVGFRITFTTGFLNFIQKPATALLFVLGITLIVDLLVYVFLFIPISLITAIFQRR